MVLSLNQPTGTGSSLRTKLRADWGIKRMGEAGGERLGQGTAVAWLALKAWLTDLNSVSLGLQCDITWGCYLVSIKNNILFLRSF